jgi:hypothetical protein
MRTALFPSGDGMLNFSAFFIPKFKNHYSCLVSDIVRNDVEEVLHKAPPPLARFGDKFCDYDFNRLIQ